MRRLLNVARSALFMRIWMAALALLLALAVGRLMGPETYGTIALALFAAKVSPILTAGSAYGMIKARLSGDSAAPRLLGFLSVYQVHLLLGTMVLAWLFGKDAFWLALALVPVVSLDSVEKINERLHYGLVPDVVCYSSVLAVTWLAGGFDMAWCAGAAALCSIAVWARSVFRLARNGERGDRMRLSDYAGMMKAGFSLQLLSVLISVLLIMDRYFLSHFWGAALLGVFMLAYQLAQAATFPAQSLTQLYLLRYSKLEAEGLTGLAAWRRVLKGNRLFSLLAVCAPFVALSIAAAYPHFAAPGFAQLPMYGFLLTAGAVLWAVSSAFLPRLFFSGRMRMALYPVVALIAMDCVMHIVAIRFIGDFVYVPAVQVVMFLTTAVVLVSDWNRHRRTGQWAS